MSAFRRETSKGQMANTLCVRIHMQVHADEVEGRRAGFTDGVRTQVHYLKTALFNLRVFVGVSSLEDAILVKDANPIMTQILARFIRNLRPQTRNLRCAQTARPLCMSRLVC